MFGSHALLLDCFDKTNVPIIIALERIRIVLFFGYKILIVTVIDTSFQKNSVGDLWRTTVHG